ncbi:MAG: cation transporter, partial [Deltaproteobacteria bacterium]|nr:cation transporter [Deltaproteobacteria bacterium]
MHIYNLERWKTRHDFEISYRFGESRTRIVLALTGVTMIIEIIAGMVFGSMALLADGWHIATHVAAFGITIFAYRYARKNKDNPDFTFSIGKVSALGA